MCLFSYIEYATSLTLSIAREEMQRLANTLYIGNVVEKAFRLYKIGRHHAFHRPQIETIAVCLYIACRMTEGNTVLLIDIAEKIRRNVFDLGTVYKSFVRDTSLDQMEEFREMPVIDIEPLLYKFAKRLEFGDATRAVANDAALILSRMGRDWMVTGRQPQALCGSALILAARMNNFRRSIREVVYVVKAGDATISRRMEEFRRTKAGRLSVQKFREIGGRLKDDIEPPSVYQAREKRIRQEERLREGSVIVISSDEDSSSSEEEEETQQPRVDGDGFAIPKLPISKTSQSTPSVSAKKKGGRPRNIPIEEENPVTSTSSPVNKRRRIAEDLESLPIVKKSGRGRQTTTEESSESESSREQSAPPESASKKTKSNQSRATTFDEETLDVGSSREHTTEPTSNNKRQKKKRTRTPAPFEPTVEDLDSENRLEKEIETLVQEKVSVDEVFEVTAARAKAIAEAEREREGRQDIPEDAIIGEDEFDDDPEVANCLLSSAEIEVKEKIWVTHNHDWLRRQQEMLLDKAMEEAIGKKKRKKAMRGAKSASEYDTPASTPAEAAQRMLAKKNGKAAFSRHINYDKLQQIYSYGDLKPPNASKDDEEEEDEEEEETEKVATNATAGAEDEEDEDEDEDEEEVIDDDFDDAGPPRASDFEEDDVDLDEVALGGNSYFDY
jgi:transcription factor IIIB subunit 2